MSDDRPSANEVAPAKQEDAKMPAVRVKSEADLAIQSFTCDQLILTCQCTKSVNEITRRARITDAWGEHVHPKCKQWLSAEREKRLAKDPHSLGGDNAKLGVCLPDAIALSSDEATVDHDLELEDAAQKSAKTDGDTANDLDIADAAQESDKTADGATLPTSAHAKAPSALRTPPRIPPGVTPDVKRPREEAKADSPSDSTDSSGSPPPPPTGAKASDVVLPEKGAKASDVVLPEKGVAPFAGHKKCRASATFLNAKCDNVRLYSTEYQVMMQAHPESNQRKTNSEWIGQFRKKMRLFRTAFITKAQEYTHQYGGLCWNFALPDNALTATEAMECYEVGLAATLGTSRHPCYDVFIFYTIEWFVDFNNRYFKGMTGVLVLHIINAAIRIRHDWLHFDSRATKKEPQANPLKIECYITAIEES